MRIIDATNSIVGRLSATVAKLALDGELVVIVNAEKAVISGNPKEVLRKYLENIHRGSRYKGPFQPRMPDRILRRTIRGMLPYKKTNGLKAFKRIKVFIGEPEQYKGKSEQLSNTLKTNRVTKFITLKELSQRLGVKL